MGEKTYLQSRKPKALDGEKNVKEKEKNNEKNQSGSGKKSTT